MCKDMVYVQAYEPCYGMVCMSHSVSVCEPCVNMRKYVCGL